MTSTEQQRVEEIAGKLMRENGDAMREANRIMQTAKPFASAAQYEDRIERLDPPFYIRWTSGPDYEDAYLCVEDGEPDMHDFAKVSFGMARLFKEALAVRTHLQGQAS